jgi:hypothetical protein
MATIPSHTRLKDVENAANFMALVQDNFEILAGETAKREPTYQNGTPTTVIGAPTTGDHVVDEFWRDALGGEWICSVAGTPGTWKQIRPAAETVDPSSGTIPTGYLIWNVTDGALKRHAGGYSWEIGIGVDATAKVGFHGATPTGQRSGADQTVATDLTTGITLANELRAALVEKGLIKGGV